jgi:hypothetical protein
MATDPTIGELFKQALILDADVHAAVNAYMADAETGVFPVGEGYGLDLGAAVDAHGPARKAVADPNASDTFKRSMVRAAIIMARPTKG